MLAFPRCLQRTPFGRPAFVARRGLGLRPLRLIEQGSKPLRLALEVNPLAAEPVGFGNPGLGSCDRRSESLGLRHALGRLGPERASLGFELVAVGPEVFLLVIGIREPVAQHRDLGPERDEFGPIDLVLGPHLRGHPVRVAPLTELLLESPRPLLRLGEPTFCDFKLLEHSDVPRRLG